MRDERRPVPPGSGAASDRRGGGRRRAPSCRYSTRSGGTRPVRPAPARPTARPSPRRSARPGRRRPPRSRPARAAQRRPASPPGRPSPPPATGTSSDPDAADRSWSWFSIRIGPRCGLIGRGERVGTVAGWRSGRVRRSARWAAMSGSRLAVTSRLPQPHAHGHPARAHASARSCARNRYRRGVLDADGNVHRHAEFGSYRSIGVAAG